MVDRFGNPPKNVENLIDATKLKLLLENHLSKDTGNPK